MIQGMTVANAVGQYEKEGIVTIVKDGKPMHTDIECVDCGKLGREENGLNWCPREENTICDHCCCECSYNVDGECIW